MPRALRAMRELNTGMLCVTLGAAGAMLMIGDELIVESGFAVKAVDTTGAGDVFRAAFVDGLLRGMAPRDLLRFANAAAAISCTRSGAMNSVPAREEVERLITGA